MNRSLLPFALVLTIVACNEEPLEQDLTPDEYVAVEAALEAVDDLQTDLPVEAAELEAMAISNVVEARDLSNCEVQGVLSGVWYDADLAPVFEGSWFQLGTGDLGGTVVGEYGEGIFSGSFDGTNVGEISGVYDDGLVMGDWAETDPDASTGIAGATGELIGRYERRNAYGGYFFGLWGQCD